MKARIVQVASEVNPGKLQKLDELHLAYVTYAQVCLTKMIGDRKPSIPAKGRYAYFPKTDLVSSTLAVNTHIQVSDLVETWVRSLYGRKLRHLIRKTKEFTDQQRLELYTIGKYLVTKAGKFGKGEISQEMLDLFWSWVWDPDVSGRPPSISERLPIVLNSLTLHRIPTKTAKHFDGWVGVTCLEKGKRLQLPLDKNPLLSKSAKLAQTVLLKKRYGRWTFQFVEKTEEAKLDGSKGTLGVDVGLNCLAATSDGRLYGQDFKPRFDRVYAKVKAVRANRQRQDLKEDSPRLARLEQRLTGMTKTETGRITNKLVRDFPDHTFVIEDLDLRGCKGQRRFAYRQLQRSLESKAVVKTVNPAYTSQQCPSCGYVDRRNRTGVKFTCRSCGRKSHADVVGGINLLRRSEDKQVGLYDHPSDVKTFLKARYRHRRNSALDRSQNELSGFNQELTTRVPKGSGIAPEPHMESSQ